MVDLLLNCIVRGDSTAFSVSMQSTSTVGQLKQAIKAELVLDMPPKDLALWKAHIPVADAEKDVTLLQDVIDSTPTLKEDASISEVFHPSEGAPKKLLHIIAQLPQQALKRDRQDSNDDMRFLKRFKPDATVYEGMRQYVYYADQTESNAPLIEAIVRHGFVRLYGARASGNSSRIVDAMTTLTEEGYRCVYVDLENINVSSREIFWSSLGQHLKALGYPVDIKDSDDFLKEFYTRKKWRRPVVIFFDACDTLLQDSATEVCSSMLGVIRSIRNEPRYEIHAVLSVVFIGTYAILQLNQTNQALSPFNFSDSFRNTSLSRGQVRDLYRELAEDHAISMDDNVIEDIFVKTNGHAGLVNVFGVAIENSLGTLPDSRQFDMGYLESVGNTLLTSMREYRIFWRLDRELRGRSQMLVAALEYYRTWFLGNPSDETVYVGGNDNRNLAGHLAALGVLNPGSEGKFYVASPLMDSFIRQIVIPTAFPDVPNISPPLRSDGSLDILEVIKSALQIFDKDLISQAHESLYKEAHVVVDKAKKRRVPRESVYDSEMTRILMN
ncbi:hypothetical protein EDD11_001972 [Mortierella claussenii]|nr:hypothetical protein EDD11_001972 [Mortierella claussenii]